MKAGSVASLALAVALGFSACGEGIHPSSPSTTVAPGPGGRVAGSVFAGPVCPVETDPPDPACADRPVAGAVILVTFPDGSPVTRVRSDAQGRFSVALPVGTYRFTPQPVAGLLGTAGETEAEITAGGAVALTFLYDTGIRGPAGG